jgi:hypothetical protein
MSWWNAISFGANLLGIGSSASSQRKAYNIAKQETPAEKAYRLKLEKAKLEGDPLLFEKEKLAYKPIQSYGESARADATGVAIRQGLENSMIAQEMKSKIDAQTYQALETTADKIALYNEEYKKRAEDDLDKYNMERQNYLRDLAVGYESNRPDILSQILTEIAGFGYAQSGGTQNTQGSPNTSTSIQNPNNPASSYFSNYLNNIINNN